MIVENGVCSNLQSTSQHNLTQKQTKATTNMKRTADDIATLLSIKCADDITQVEIIDEYEDDRAICADVKVNGAPIEFMWYDNLGFIRYWNDSPKAKQDLFESIQHSIDTWIVQPAIDDAEATASMIEWQQAYNSWLEQLQAANSKK